jgi:hypothetical protein
MDLSDNDFVGPIPSELGSLRELKELRINRMRGVNGTLPSLSGLQSIVTMELEANNITGQIPSDFLAGRDDRFTELRISLRDNQLSGALPSQLSIFLDVQLDLAGNRIVSVPDELCDEEHQDWMGGEVGLVGNCSAVLCPPRTWSLHGKAVSRLGVECEPCSNNPFYGANVCTADNVVSTNREREILDVLFISTGGRYVKRLLLVFCSVISIHLTRYCVAKDIGTNRILIGPSHPSQFAIVSM